MRTDSWQTTPSDRSDHRLTLTRSCLLADLKWSILPRYLGLKEENKNCDPGSGERLTSLDHYLRNENY